MILSFRITKEQKEALLSHYPDIKRFVEKTISEAADKIIIDQVDFNVDRELKEYHDRKILNDYDPKRRKMTQSTKDKIRNGLKKYFAKFEGQEFHLSSETKNLISLGNKGKIISKETRENISKALIGKKRTEEQKQNISLGHKGMKYKKHTKAGLS